MEYTPRQFESDQEIIEIGEGLLLRSLPKSKWTHEAHFASVVYLLLKKPKIHLERELPIIISNYNEAVGGMNTDTMGYHETLTQIYIRLIRNFVLSSPRRSLKDTCNALVASEYAHREFPLRFYSRELLFSVPARRGWVDPDLGPLPV